MRRSLPLFCFLLLAVSALWADSPAFDLTGPKVDVHVKRGDVTLPIGQAPNLLPGDRLWIHPDFPDSQSERYVLVVAFLRGATNPPPPDWFTRVDTWTRQARNEGVFVTVPKEAQQALVFLVPETGGDFSTLRKAVHDRPGAFVRAGQDLQAASWDRMRLDAYLNEVRATSQIDPKTLKERAESAARSLGIKLDQQCFDKPTDQQAPCLVQHTEGLVLDDANAQSLVSQLASGTTGDLMNQLSYSSMGGGGQFSPYVGAIVDTAKILASLHTAHFQYIPALALPTKDTLNLRLNLPPSFRDPKSVVVVALPPVGPSKAPPLHPGNPLESSCAQKPGLVLQAEGAPLVFATELAHDLSLHIEAASGPLDLPLAVSSSKGGLVFQKPLPDLPAGELTGVIRGKWGFDDWEGPRFHLLSAGPQKWAIGADDQSALIVGRDDTLHVKGSSTLCVSSVTLRKPDGGDAVPLKWKATKPELLEVGVPLKDATPQTLLLDIHQYGLEKPDTLDLDAYAEAASLEHLTFSAGDRDALLKGTRLDEVAKATLGGLSWSPAGLARVQDFDQLTLNTEGSTLDFDPTKTYTAKVVLRDGRELKVPVHGEFAAAAGDPAEQGHAGRFDGDALAGAHGQRGRCAAGGAAGVLSEVGGAADLSAQPEHRGGGGGWELPYRAVAGGREPDARRQQNRIGHRGAAGAFRIVGVRTGSGAGGRVEWRHRGLDAAGNAGARSGIQGASLHAPGQESLHVDRDEPVPCGFDIGGGGFFESDRDSAGLHWGAAGGAASGERGALPEAAR